MHFGRFHAQKFALLLFVLAGFGPANGQTFANPVFKGADPSVTLVDGTFYSVGSGCPDPLANGSKGHICIRAAPTLVGLGTAKPVVVWRAPLFGPNTTDIWAPDIVYYNGSWYIYYAGDVGDNRHHLFALVPNSPGQMLGPWSAAKTDGVSGELPINWLSDWAIDPDVFVAADHKLYLTYSCRPTGNEDAANYKFQSICLSAMSDPLHLTGKVVSLSTPTQPWETRHFPTQEGPVGITHNGVTYIIYSGSFSGSPDSYAEGILSNDSPPQLSGTINPIMNPASWVKSGPIFDGHHAAYGTASVDLIASADHTELWNVYHGVDCFAECRPQDVFGTWSSRSIRMQPAYWSSTGGLVLGYPFDIITRDKTGKAVPLPLPSVDGKGTSALAAWGAAFGDAVEGDTEAGLKVGDWDSPQGTSTTVRSTSLDPKRLDQIFYGSNPNLENYVLSADVQMVESGQDDAAAKYGLYGAYVDHRNFYMVMFDVHSCAAPGCLTTYAVVNGSDKGWKSCPLAKNFDPKVPNHLTIEATGGTYNVSVNGEALEGACQNRKFFLNYGQETTNLSNGQVGAVVEDTRTIYTNFNVSYGVPVDSEEATAGFTRNYNLPAQQMYAFRNQASRLNLDNHCAGCKGARDENSLAIQFPATSLYPLATSPSQLWTLHSMGGGWFSIRSVLSKQCLADDNAPGTTLPQAVAKQVPCKNAASQGWQFVPRGDSHFSIRNKATMRTLQVTDNDPQRLIHLGKDEASKQQNWLLIIE
jgi:GH43 family beta-xylosidase